MSAKTEIERRLRANDYKKISKELFNKSFDDDLSDNEYIDILKIADIYGTKYKRFYKLKTGIDIKTFTSNLTNKAYAPCYDSHSQFKYHKYSKN